MRIESTMDVPVELGEVWAALLDVERIAPCLPGASIDEDRGNGEYGGSMRIKLGPVTSTFQGTLRIKEANDAEHRAVIEASARDTRGQGAASATITSSLTPGDGGTRVDVVTDMQLAGTAAQFGRGVVSDVSQKLLGEFADRLADEIQHPAERAATDGPAARGAGRDPAPEGRPARNQPEPLDLTAAGRDAVLKRIAPIAAGVAGASVLLLLARGRGGARRRPYVIVNGPLFTIERGHHGSRRRDR